MKTICSPHPPWKLNIFILRTSFLALESGCFVPLSNMFIAVFWEVSMLEDVYLELQS